MDKIKVLVTSNREVVRGGVALIINSASNLEVVGTDGMEVLKEAIELQPDLLVYELNSTNDNDYETLCKLKESCSWTKVIIFSADPLNKESLKRFLGLCDGYLQGPILPGFFLKAVELASYSGYFFFLGSSKYITSETKKNVICALFESSHGKN